jgi:hypothetical protein
VGALGPVTRAGIALLWCAALAEVIHRMIVFYLSLVWNKACPNKNLCVQGPQTLGLVGWVGAERRLRP